MAVRESRIYPAWRQTRHLPRLAASPVFIPLGGEPKFYLAWREPCIYLAWRRAQCLPSLAAPQVLSRLAASPVFTPLGGKPSIYLAWRAPGKKNGGLPRRPASANIRAAAPFITLRCATAATFVPLLLWDGGGRRCCLTVVFFCRLSFSTHR